ncbi:Uu.00g039330.m01.CDS01 [Anthostomella pinea]|uniref:Uu.00g039330.m01.CDS01 n=1 Tax=Anthostomella pinea TaxID=933095 RepID=A0AAI8V9Z4_9PEZI|nr:Uu.00g039330.m01.CDS01 [Anthostomella pinea]
MQSQVAHGQRRRSFSSRPFYTTVFLLSLFAVYSLFIKGPSVHRQEQQSLVARSGEDCRLVHNAHDKCAFVKRNCHDDEAGLLEYLTLYYCNLGHAQPVAFIILVSWLGLLFTTIGIAASDFFSVNLSTIATILGLSESLAGVTFLAFGNGSPDVFSTFAAMSSNSGSMAVGELIGAAGFITSVVAGSMALVHEFKVSKTTFVRDICFFIVAVGFTMGFLADGNIHLWECCVMIGFYAFYVIFVVGWHAFVKRRNARKAKEDAARGHFFAPAGDRVNDELEPYRDDPDNEDTTVSAGRGPATVDIGMLERGPRIEIGPADEDEVDEADRRQHVAAEVASSMRVTRPRGRRSTTTITPIRPSLVGALEFRAVLSSLQREGNVRMRPITARSHSADRLRPGQGVLVGGTRSAYSAQTVEALTGRSSASRSRAQSSGAIPPTFDADLVARRSIEDEIGAPSPHTIGGKLAPPPNDFMGSRPTETDVTGDKSQPSSPLLHRLSIPSSPATERPSPHLSPFPGYTDSPLVMTPNAQEPPHFMLPTPADERNPQFPSMIARADTRPVKWWPYQVLPAPHVLLNTLFPTLQGWRNKSIWDKLISVISVPTIFLLVITLPVVESDTTDDEESGDSIVEQPATGHLGNTAAAVSYESEGSIEPETEWQRYRRSTISRASSRSPSPALITLDSPNDTPPYNQAHSASSLPSLNIQPSKPVSVSDQDNSTLQEEEHGWNRWLLILQIFVGPAFCVLVVWANMAEELERPIKHLVRALLISLVGSLVLLAILLMTTSPTRRPKYHFMFCFLGFCISIAWISTVAGEVVGVLKAFGVILDISEAILGLTIFAVGNSVGDLVADITVARLGYPVMALSACFGGPLLNILLGVGLGGAYQTIHAANKRKAKHPEKAFRYKPYHIQVSGTLMVSAIALLVTLLALLVVVPMNKWVMSRKIGWGLIALWSVSTVLNLVIEVTGFWQEIA